MQNEECVDIKGYTHVCMRGDCRSSCPKDVRDCTRSQLFLVEDMEEQTLPEKNNQVDLDKLS